MDLNDSDAGDVMEDEKQSPVDITEPQSLETQTQTNHLPIQETIELKNS